MLVDVIPVDARGERGVTRIMTADRVQAWTVANAADLLAYGYVRVIVEDHIPTVAFGDKRSAR